MKKLIAVLAIALLSIGMVACEKKDPAADYPSGNMSFVAPGGAGGGWDTTIRAVAQTLGETKLVSVNMPVRNNPGAGGSKHLAEMQKKKDADDTLVVYSSPLLLTKLSGTTDLNHKNTTPISNLIADYAVFVVKADSPYNTLTEVMDALKQDPKSVKIGGASAAGSMDHIQFLIMAKAAGVADLRAIPYISFDDSGTAQVLGGHIDLFSTGLSEVNQLIESGHLKALAQSAETAKFGIPSCKEQGIDATFVNWRGIFGPEEMPEYAVTYWADTLAKMVKTPEWDAQKKKYGWDDFYVPKDEYPAFLDARNAEFEDILGQLGMLK